MCGARSDVQRRGTGAGSPKLNDRRAEIEYNPGMGKAARRLSANEVAIARKRRLEGMVLQEIEGNPLDAEDIAMFEMFEREGWDGDRCREYILAQIPVAAK
jgi:hypothetical protein